MQLVIGKRSILKLPEWDFKLTGKCQMFEIFDSIHRTIFLNKNTIFYILQICLSDHCQISFNFYSNTTSL